MPRVWAGDSANSANANLTSTIDARIEQWLPGWLALYRDLHSNPELSLQESASAAKIAGHLKGAGFTVTAGVGGHGVVGVLENGAGPTVMIRGDMDALPITEETDLPHRSTRTVEKPDGTRVGVMHACGHDVHQTCLVGTAATLASMRDAWSGTLLIVAQPAEEIGVGALAMINDGLFGRFPKPDVCLALHVSSSQPAGTVAYTPGWALANVDSVDITIHGRGGHGSRPHETVDPIVTAAHVIVALQTVESRRLDPLEPGVITVGSVHAGSKHNIIPNTAELQITVRSYAEESRRVLLDGIREVTLNICRAMGCPKDPDVMVRSGEFTPATYNDPALTRDAAAVLADVLGAEHVVEIKPVMGGEDFGRFPKHLNVPGLIFWLGAVPRELYDASLKPDGPRLPPIHSSTFAPDPEPTVATGVRSMSALAISRFRRER
ncbi:MAG: amidohydrolase [Phycisphaerales bacterium]|nr:amidohydrolase [Phycisphaerales bacterium]